jgi:hypothetical protein
VEATLPPCAWLWPWTAEWRPGEAGEPLVTRAAAGADLLAAGRELGSGGGSSGVFVDDVMIPPSPSSPLEGTRPGGALCGRMVMVAAIEDNGGETDGFRVIEAPGASVPGVAERGGSGGGGV